MAGGVELTINKISPTQAGLLQIHLAVVGRPGPWAGSVDRLIEFPSLTIVTFIQIVPVRERKIQRHGGALQFSLVMPDLRILTISIVRGPCFLGHSLAPPTKQIDRQGFLGELSRAGSQIAGRV